MDKLPIKLARDPIIEAVFEIRFLSKISSAADLLPGLLYPKFKEQFKNPVRLPIADLPRQFQELDASLRYQPRLKMEGDKYTIFVGDRSAIISCPRPYVGWIELRRLIAEVMTSFHETDFISEVERVSLKYINVLEAPTPKEQFQFAKFSAKIAKYKLTDWPTQVTTAITENGITNIVELKANSVVTIDSKGKKESFTGLLVTVDSICKNPENFWETKEELVDRIHLAEKRLFFGLLTEDTTKNFGAIWK